MRDQNIVDTIAKRIVNSATTAIPYLKEATVTNPTLASRIEPVLEEIRVIKEFSYCTVRLP